MDYFPLRQHTHLGCRDGKAASIIGAGPGLLPKGHKLFHVLHLQQNLIPEKLHLLMIVEGARSLDLLSPSLWLVFPSSVLFCGGTDGGKQEQQGAQLHLGSGGGRYNDVETHLFTWVNNCYLLWTCQNTLGFLLYALQN